MRLKKIRHQMLAMFGLVVLFGALLLGVFATSRVRTILIREMVDNQAKLGQAVHQGLGIKFSKIERQVSHLTADPDFQRTAPEPVRNLLARFLEQNPLFVSALIYEPDGTVRQALRRHDPGASYLVGKNLLKQPEKFIALAQAFQDALATKRMTVSPAVLTARQGLLVVLNFPVTALDDPGTVTGILSLGIQLSGAVLQETLQRFHPGDGFIFLTDREGNILAQRGDGLPDGLEGITVNPAPRPGAAISTWTSLKGKEFLLFAAPFPHLQGLLVIGHPREKILGVVNDLSLGLVFLALVSLLVAMGLGILMSERFINQILLLVEGIQKVGTGVLSWRVSNPPDDELGDACRAFNEMTERLERNRMIEEHWRQQWNRPR